MEKNCFITELSEVINNDNLLPIGSRKILVTVPETTQPYEIVASYFVQGGTMRIDGEGSFLTSTGESLGKSIVVSTIPESKVYLSSGTYYIIFDSYNVRELRNNYLANNENKRLNVNGVNFNDIYEFSEHLCYLSFYGLQNINCNINQFLNKLVYPELNRISTNYALNGTQDSCAITIDLDTVENLNAIEFRELNFTGTIDKNLLTGSIENLNFDISSHTSVSFYIRDSVLYGELKNVLDSLVAQGKTGRIEFMGNGIVTLNGTALGETTKTFNITPEGWTEQ